MLEPLIGLAYRARLDPAMVLSATDFAAQKSSTFQHHHMLGNGIEGHGEGLGDFLDGGRTMAKGAKDGATRGIPQRTEDTIQLCRLFIFNHSVEYYRCMMPLSNENTDAHQMWVLICL